MDDLELDRELDGALAVTPSPEFVARVRTKIAEAPRPSFTAGWLKPAAAVGCAALLAIAVGLPREDARLKPTPAEASRPIEEAPVTAGLQPSTMNVQTGSTGMQSRTTQPLAPGIQAVVVPTLPPSRLQRFGGHAVGLAKAGRSATPIRSAQHVSATTKEPPLPEVIIAPEDVEALRQFVIGAHELRFVASFDETPAPIPWVMTELSVSPMTIEPSDSVPVHNN